MGDYKSFGDILREQLARSKQIAENEANTAIEISISNPPTLGPIEYSVDYEALIRDRGLTGEEEKFVYAVRAMDMILHTEALKNLSATSLAIINIFDVHILSRLDTPYPDRYGMIVIVLLEEALEQNKFLQETAFTNRIAAVGARMSYDLVNS